MPLLACADDLTPESLDKAIEKHKILWATDNPDPMNHEIWKLYIRTVLSSASGFDKTPKLLIAGLKQDGEYRVMLQINQLYNYLQTRPMPGDVIVVEGRITGAFKYHISSLDRNYTLKALSMYADGAVNLPNEHFDPSASRLATPASKVYTTPTPGGPGAGFSAMPKIPLSPTPTPGGPRRQ